jgi:nitronate monooxygenase
VSGRLSELLGIELPIIQAPMAGVQGSELAVAVSNAGGLGSLPCAMLSPDNLGKQLTAIRDRTDRPYNVNFFCHATPEFDSTRDSAWRALLEPYYRAYGLDSAHAPDIPQRVPFGREAADVLERFRPPVVSFHFGLPSGSLMARVKSWGSRVLSSATTVEEACWLEKHGADAIIAQGLEAGGHRGMFLSTDLSSQVGLFALLPRVIAAVRVPVIAAGGISDIKGIAAAQTLGAAGVQIGTAYLLCPEATTSAVHRAALRGESRDHTAVTNIFTGRPARGMVNRLMRDLGPINDAAPAFPLAGVALAPLRSRAEGLGSGDFSPLWCGQNAGGCVDKPAALLTQILAGRA